MFGSVLLIMSHNIFPDESEIHLLKEKYHPTGVVFWKSSEDGTQTLVRYEGEVTESFTVDEVGVFIVKPLKHSRAGLFLDAKNLRERLKENSKGDFLNLFSFTGSLSVSALLGGASSVVNVDASQAALTWSKENHAINGVSARHLREDVMTYVQRNSSTLFDCIIADPPSFGRFKNKVFSIKKDLRTLIRGCSNRLKPNGKFMLLYHTRDMPLDDINCHGENAGLSVSELITPDETVFPTKQGSSNIIVFKK